MRTSEVFDAAADLIEERGWAVGTRGYNSPYFSRDPWGEDGGACCIEGALMNVLGIRFQSELTYTDEYLLMVEHVGNPPALYAWNDDRGRTPEEVIAALRAAAVIQRSRESVDELVSA